MLVRPDAYLLKDSEQARAYYQQFLELARKEENSNAQLLEMMQKAEEMLVGNTVMSKNHQLMHDAKHCHLFQSANFALWRQFVAPAVSSRYSEV